jgi:hypothetical protein
VWALIENFIGVGAGVVFSSVGVVFSSFADLFFGVRLAMSVFSFHSQNGN